MSKLISGVSSNWWMFWLVKKRKGKRRWLWKKKEVTDSPEIFFILYLLFVHFQGGSKVDEDTQETHVEDQDEPTGDGVSNNLEVRSGEKAHDGVFAAFSVRGTRWLSRPIGPRTTATTFKFGKVSVVHNHDARQEGYHRAIVDYDENSRKHPKGVDPQERWRRTDEESNGCCDWSEQHCQRCLSVAVRHSVGQRLVRVMGGFFPGINEHKHIICANTQHNEHSEHVENTDVAEVENEVVNQIRSTESSYDAEYCPACDPEGTRLDCHENANEAKTSNGQGEIKNDLSRNPQSDDLFPTVSEFHVPCIVREVFVPFWHNLIFEELFKLCDLSIFVVCGVGVSLKRPPEEYDRLCHWTCCIWCRYVPVFCQESFHCSLEVCHVVRCVKYSWNVLEICIVQQWILFWVSSVKESNDRLGFGTLALRNEAVFAHVFDIHEILFHPLDFLQIFFCEHITVWNLKQQAHDTVLNGLLFLSGIVITAAVNDFVFVVVSVVPRQTPEELVTVTYVQWNL